MKTVVFSPLLDSEHYLPGLWDLHRDSEAKAYWIRTLARNLEHMANTYAEDASPSAGQRCRKAQAEYLRYLSDFESSQDPERPRTVNALVEVRQDIFERFGVPDPYKSTKELENTGALAMLPEVSDASSSKDPLRERLRWAFSLVMAGNFFDMGSAEARKYHTGVSRVLLERAAHLMAKVWFIDDLDRLAAHVENGPMRGGPAVICIDNAGAEAVLGVPALVKALASAGFACTLVANESPALNDMTASETAALFQMIGAVDQDLKTMMESRRVKVVSSGSRTSGLDLTRVSKSFDDAASKADIIVVIGQGRAVETNWKTRLAQPWARAAVVKDRLVARALGCQVFDPLLTFEIPE